LKDDVDEENDNVGQHEGDQVVSIQARINVLETIFLKRISYFYFIFLSTIFLIFSSLNLLQTKRLICFLIRTKVFHCEFIKK